VLAKHDENYTPPEAEEAVKKAHETSRKAQQTLVESSGAKR
jgi:cytochrome c-type biogenesis protein CcmE